MAISGDLKCSDCNHIFSDSVGDLMQSIQYRCRECDFSKHITRRNQEIVVVCPKCDIEMERGLMPMCPKCKSRNTNLHGYDHTIED